MPDQTDTVETVGKVLATLALTSAEKSYAFTKNASMRSIEAMSDQDWYYAYASGGPYYPVAGSREYTVKLKQDPQTLYFKRQTIDSILNLLVIE